MVKNPVETYDRIISWQHHVLRILGLDWYSPNHSVSGLTATIMSMALFFQFVSFYDLLVVFRNDLFGKAFVMSTICFGFIGCMRILVGLANRHKIPKLLQMARATYSVGGRQRETRVLKWYTEVFRKVVLLYSGTFLVGCLAAIIFPLLVLMYSGQKILPFGVFLPYVDPNTDTGYEVNFLYQVSSILWAPPGLTATQNMFFSLIINICVQYDLLLIQLADLDELIHSIFAILGNFSGRLPARHHLTCAGLMTIDMKLFMSVVKKVYSLFMMLENM
ncbi:uncharacterized protein LOC131207449 [Anopheles bellator]|uniref:uncharacterized protein LOC131207449 n=1 Tax=Anopheles bellator TaxID=139047 RepID=UPI0026492D64|nr:uncharacterized protein LOC131207449 [Anopheles bellator]